jgi:hypothetical protein
LWEKVNTAAPYFFSTLLTRPWLCGWTVCRYNSPATKPKQQH